jgi:hypothetical protein
VGSAESDPVTVTVNQVAQSISFAALPHLSYPSGVVTLAGSASSGLTVSYRVLSGPGNVSGDQLSLTGTGTLVLEASQAGNGTYLAATPVTNSVTIKAAMATVVGRWVFYNNSAWDGNSAAANTNDDAAIALDKAALLPGRQATFTNYTSYSRGINGIMVDLQGITNPGGISLSDFLFNTGNDNSPAGWASAPAPATLSVRPGAGVNGSTRITLIWQDGKVTNTWLAVTVRSTANTLLSTADQFFFGNAIGETGNSQSSAQVNLQDAAVIRANPATFLNPASVTSLFDINRDKRVNITDEAVTRSHTTTFLTALKLINLTSYVANPSVYEALSETASFAAGTMALAQSSTDELVLESVVDEGQNAAQLWWSLEPDGPWTLLDPAKSSLLGGKVRRWKISIRADDSARFYQVRTASQTGGVEK